MEPMTVFSRDMFELTQQINTIEEAVETLLSYEHFRTLGDVLRSLTADPDIKKRLVSGLSVWFPNDDPNSIDRKVRNWLNGKTQSLSKQDAYIVSHILGLPLEKTDKFLKYATGEGIHWRNVEDIVWCYSLIHNMLPEETRSLLRHADDAVSKSGAVKDTPESFTAEVFEKLSPVLHLDEDALLAFLTSEQHRLGSFHNTAYELFQKYMDLLMRGFSDHDIEANFKEMNNEEKKKAEIRVDGDVGLHQAEPITVRDILEIYMYRKLVPVQARGSKNAAAVFSSVQRSIRQNWPDEFALSKIESRKVDVSRKVLILLFLATDGSNSDYSDEYDTYDEYTEYDSEMSKDEIFLSLYIRLNTMLNACGFLPLDPRNPFDWMILFCISSGDLWESDERLHSILTEIFPK